mgnify:CR=1 FL=1
MFKKVFQIEIRVQAISLRRFDDGINCRTGLGPLGGRTEQPVLPADGEGPDGVLRQVVGQGAPPVFQICIFRSYSTICTVKSYRLTGKSVPLNRPAVPNDGMYDPTRKEQSVKAKP